MSADALADELVELANRVRDALRDGQTVDVLETLDHLQQASRQATGAQLALLEVASALLKAMTCLVLHIEFLMIVVQKNIKL